MNRPQIELITCDSGDWEVLKSEGKVFGEDHHIRNRNWIHLLNNLGFTVNETNISDEDMEMKNY